MAFNRKTNKYIVAWDTLPPNTWDLSKILVLLIRSNGIPYGPAVKVSETGHAGVDTDAVVHHLTKRMASDSKDAYIIFWSHYPWTIGNKDDVGLWAALLDRKGNLRNVKCVMKGNWQLNPWKSFGVIPEDVIYLPTDGAFLVGVRREIMSDGHFEARLIKTFTNGSLREYTILETHESFNTRLMHLSPDLIMAGSYSATSQTYLYRRLNGDLQDLLESLSPLKTNDVRYSEPVKLQNSAGGYQFSATLPDTSPTVLKSGALYGSYIKPNGQISRKVKKIFSTDYEIEDIQAIGIPDTNFIFVVWQNKISDNKSEIRGKVFKAVKISQ